MQEPTETNSAVDTGGCEALPTIPYTIRFNGGFCSLIGTLAARPLALWEETQRSFLGSSLATAPLARAHVWELAKDRTWCGRHVRALGQA
jgi:hypothetical protein